MSTEDFLSSQEEDEQKPKFVLGLDIGYGNVKMAYGYAGKDFADLKKKLTVKSFPATFMKIISEDPTLTYKLKNEEKIVKFKEREKEHDYVVFAKDSSKLPTFEDDRCLDVFYPQTEQYMVLFLGALLETRQKEIDLLVIGLPVDQAKKSDKIEYVKKRLTGTFQPSRGKTVTVKEVMVIAQPVGAYFSFASNSPNPPEAFQQSTLFIDTGFYSVDWVLMVSGIIRERSSGSNPNAVSMIIEDTVFRVASEQNGGDVIGATRFEDAVRGGRNYVVSKGKKIEFGNVFGECSENRVTSVIRSIKKAVRADEKLFDDVVLVGGGASYLEAAVREYFPRQNVFLEANNLTANAEGFYWYGVLQLKH